MKKKFSYVLAALVLVLAASCSKNQREKYPIPLTPVNQKASCISFVAAPDGHVLLSWAAKATDTSSPEFYFAKWDEAKDTFSMAVKIPLETNTSFNEENKPFLVFQGKDTIWAVYSVSAPTPVNKFAGFIHYRISSDTGHSWSQPYSLLNDTIPGRSRSFANAISLPDGRLAFTWMGGMLNMKIHGRALYYATASIMGKFSEPVLIDSFACPCCRNSLAVAQSGKVAVVYRSVRENNIRDIAFASKPAGKNVFSKSVVFSNDHWQLDACPEDGPSLVVSDDKNWVGWFSGGNNKGLYYATLDNEGKMLNKKQVEKNGRYIQLARMTNGKNAVIYNSTMMMNGMKSSMIELSKTEATLLPPQELDTASYFATNPVLIQEGNSGKLLTAWIAGGRVWYKEIN